MACASVRRVARRPVFIASSKDYTGFLSLDPDSWVPITGVRQHFGHWVMRLYAAESGMQE